MGVQGNFESYKYELENGDITVIRLQPETKAANPGGVANPEPAGAVTDGLPSAMATGSRRSIGIHPRMAACRVKATGATSTNKVGSTVYIPLLSKATSPKKKTDGVYQGDTIEYYKTIPEVCV